ncbi:MAG TPA: SsrA-binding protein SmpB [candidate division Zixibacteria bacterium]|nr:SsrA-binding protein SmpB [candidate division Zixibacteria bacterium]
MNQSEKHKIIVRNRKARHDYEITATLEVGISLLGSEVKSMRDGKVNISDAYAEINNGEVLLKNLHISPYKMSNENNHDPLRIRRLLLHKREIRKLKAKTEQKGMTLIPLSIYLKGKVFKIELSLAIGRKKYDKREVIAKADAARKIKSALKKDL